MDIHSHCKDGTVLMRSSTVFTFSQFNHSIPFSFLRHTNCYLYQLSSTAHGSRVKRGESSRCDCNWLEPGTQSFTPPLRAFWNGCANGSGMGWNRTLVFTLHYESVLECSKPFWPASVNKVHPSASAIHKLNGQGSSALATRDQGWTLVGKN